jgi:antitoxin StbD
MGNPKERQAMAVSAPASEVQKKFGTYHDRAMSEPVRVTKYGRETVYIVSAKTFHDLKQAKREAVASKDLTDAEVSLIEAAEIPDEQRYSLES